MTPPSDSPRLCVLLCNPGIRSHQKDRDQMRQQGLGLGISSHALTFPLEMIGAGKSGSAPQPSSETFVLVPGGLECSSACFLGTWKPQAGRLVWRELCQTAGAPSRPASRPVPTSGPGGGHQPTSILQFREGRVLEKSQRLGDVVPAA